MRVVQLSWEQRKEHTRQERGRKAEEKRSRLLEAAQASTDASRLEDAWLDQVEQAPVYKPSEQEWEDPLAYIRSIQAEAARFGICVVRAPLAPTIPGGLSMALQDPGFKFNTREQVVRDEPWQDWGGVIFSLGKRYTLREFQDAACANAAKRYGGLHGCLPARFIERDFWRERERGEGPPLLVEYGSDVEGSLFLKEDRLGATRWNLNSLPLEPGCALRHCRRPIVGVSTPMLYVGQLFSSFAWHVEDHFMHSINYQHLGASKTWYGVPASDADAFEAVARRSVYGDAVAKMEAAGASEAEIWAHVEQALMGKTTMFSPRLLLEAGVRVARVVQEVGDYVVTFPRAYHSGFGNGFQLGEAANFSVGDWWPLGEDARQRYRRLKHPSILPQEQVLCDDALSLAKRRRQAAQQAQQAAQRAAQQAQQAGQQACGLHEAAQRAQQAAQQAVGQQLQAGKQQQQAKQQNEGRQEEAAAAVAAEAASGGALAHTFVGAMRRLHHCRVGLEAAGAVPLLACPLGSRESVLSLHCAECKQLCFVATAVLASVGAPASWRHQCLECAHSALVAQRAQQAQQQQVEQRQQAGQQQQLVQQHEQVQQQGGAVAAAGGAAAAAAVVAGTAPAAAPRALLFIKPCWQELEECCRQLEGEGVAELAELGLSLPLDGATEVERYGRRYELDWPSPCQPYVWQPVQAPAAYWPGRAGQAQVGGSQLAATTAGTAAATPLTAGGLAGKVVQEGPVQAESLEQLLLLPREAVQEAEGQREDDEERSEQGMLGQAQVPAGPWAGATSGRVPADKQPHEAEGAAAAGAGAHAAETAGMAPAAVAAAAAEAAPVVVVAAACVKQGGMTQQQQQQPKQQQMQEQAQQQQPKQQQVQLPQQPQQLQQQLQLPQHTEQPQQQQAQQPQKKKPQRLQQQQAQPPLQQQQAPPQLQPQQQAPAQQAQQAAVADPQLSKPAHRYVIGPTINTAEQPLQPRRKEGRIVHVAGQPMQRTVFCDPAGNRVLLATEVLDCLGRRDPKEASTRTLGSLLKKAGGGRVCKAFCAGTGNGARAVVTQQHAQQLLNWTGLPAEHREAFQIFLLGVWPEGQQQAGLEQGSVQQQHAVNEEHQQREQQQQEGKQQEGGEQPKAKKRQAQGRAGQTKNQSAAAAAAAQGEQAQAQAPPSRAAKRQRPGNKGKATQSAAGSAASAAAVHAAAATAPAVLEAQQGASPAPDSELSADLSAAEKVQAAKKRKAEARRVRRQRQKVQAEQEAAQAETAADEAAEAEAEAEAEAGFSKRQRHASDSGERRERSCGASAGHQASGQQASEQQQAATVSEQQQAATAAEQQRVAMERQQQAAAAEQQRAATAEEQQRAAAAEQQAASQQRCAAEPFLLPPEQQQQQQQQAEAERQHQHAASLWQLQQLQQHREMQLLRLRHLQAMEGERQGMQPESAQDLHRRQQLQLQLQRQFQAQFTDHPNQQQLLPREQQQQQQQQQQAAAEQRQQLQQQELWKGVAAAAQQQQQQRQQQQQQQQQQQRLWLAREQVAGALLESLGEGGLGLAAASFGGGGITAAGHQAGEARDFIDTLARSEIRMQLQPASRLAQARSDPPPVLRPLWGDAYHAQHAPAMPAAHSAPPLLLGGASLSLLPPLPSPAVAPTTAATTAAAGGGRAAPQSGANTLGGGEHGGSRDGGSPDIMEKVREAMQEVMLQQQQQQAAAGRGAAAAPPPAHYSGASSGATSGPPGPPAAAAAAATTAAAWKLHTLEGLQRCVMAVRGGDEGARHAALQYARSNPSALDMMMRLGLPVDFYSWLVLS